MNFRKYFESRRDTVIGAAILGGLYLAQAALRPLALPGEYDFIAELQKLIPDYPDNRFLLRLPAVAASFAGGVMMMRLAALCKIKRPGMTAAYYLLFPMVFYAGTSANAAPLMIAGILMALWGMLRAAATSELSKRAVAVFTALPGAIIAAVYAQSPFCRSGDFYLLIPPVLILSGAAFISRMEQNDKERARRFLNRIIYCGIGIAVAMSLIVLIPALLRHFKVDFPPRLAFYQAGERIFRPMMMILIPVVWLILAKNAKKCGKKLLLTAGALGFFVFVLPMTLPWNIQRELYVEKCFGKLFRELSPNGTTVCIADAADVPLFKRYFECVTVSGKEKATPAGLQSVIAGHLKTRDVVVVCSGRKQELETPRFAGKQYVIGKYRLFHYYKNGVKR